MAIRIEKDIPSYIPRIAFILISIPDFTIILAASAKLNIRCDAPSTPRNFSQ
jgi:hypothetical protein